MTDIPAIDDKNRIELYKMEYEHCVSSYQDIYHEIWKIFSYLTAISAALLVFGREYFSPGLSVCVAMLPLVYWFLGVYLPLDRYGNMRSERLAEIEEKLNADYGVVLKHFITLRGRAEWGMCYKLGFGWRVRTAVRVLGLVVIITSLAGLGYAICTRQVTKPPVAMKFQGEVQLRGPLQIELTSPRADSPQTRPESTR